MGCHRTQDLFEHGVHLRQDIQVAEAQYPYALLVQVMGSALIVGDVLRVVVLAAVEFDRE